MQVTNIQARKDRRNRKLRPVRKQTSGAEDCPLFDLCGKRILIVGGITKIKTFYRRAIEKKGAVFEYHDGCPEEAVRHDSEKIPEQVEENLEKTRKLLEYYNTSAEQQAFIERMIRYFNKERKVTEFTIEKLKALKAGIAGSAASQP